MTRERKANVLVLEKEVIWITNAKADAEVSGLDPATRQVAVTIWATTNSVVVAVGDGAVWADDDVNGHVLRIELAACQLSAATTVGKMPGNW